MASNPKPYKRDTDGKVTVWYDAIELGRDGEKRDRKFVYGKTKAEVRRKMKVAEEDQARGVDLRKDRQTVAQFLRKWIQNKPLTRKGRQMADRTWEAYVQITNDFLIPHLGHYRMARLTAGNIEDMNAMLLDAGRAPSYVKKVCDVLSKALTRAERDGAVARNVVRLAVKPDAKAPSKERPTDAQIRHLLATAAGDTDEVIVHLLVKAGLRKGEALAIRWVDLDLDAGTMAITGTVERCPNPDRSEGQPKTRLWRKPSTKSDASIRLVALALSMIPLLLRRRDEQRIEQIACKKLGRVWSNPYELVFTNPTGGPIDPRTFYDRYKRLCHRAGMSDAITVHDLRHANITVMITSNAVDPKTAQEMAGHADVRMTLGYVHTNLDLQRAAAAVIDARYGMQSDAA